MSKLRSSWGSRRFIVVTGVVALAASGLVVSLALTGPATAGVGDGYDGGWPTELIDGDSATPARVALPGDEVIRLRARPGRETDVDADGDGRFGAGDYFMFEERLLRRGVDIGRDSARCMLNHRSIMCDGTLVTRRGNIEVAGTVFFGRGVFLLAVTGGTERYRAAAGTLAVRNGPGDSDRLIVRLVD